jgi:hypothetical protein
VDWDEPDKDGPYRHLEGGEVVLLQELLRRAVTLKTYVADVRFLRVADMDDGGMGSLRFASINPVRGMGEPYVRPGLRTPMVFLLS